MALFEWDSEKAKRNELKHGVTFKQARSAFADPQRKIEMDVGHSHEESRYYCYGKVEGRILTVRFTIRSGKIRLIGAAYWRAGKKHYEQNA